MSPGRRRAVTANDIDKGMFRMLGIDEEQRRATLRLHQELDGSRVGRRWERMLRRHAGEIEALITVDEALRRQIGEALMRLALLEPGDVLDDGTVAAAHRVLEQLQIRGGVDLERDASCLRDELSLARGRSLAQVLAGPRPAADDLPVPALAAAR